MNLPEAEHNELGRGVGLYSRITRNVIHSTSSVSPPFIATIHIVEGFPTSQSESKATLRTIEKLRKYFQIFDSVGLRIPNLIKKT